MHILEIKDSTEFVNKYNFLISKLKPSIILLKFCY